MISIFLDSNKENVIIRGNSLEGSFFCETIPYGEFKEMVEEIFKVKEETK